MKRTELKNGGYIRLATEEETTELNTVIFEVIVFKESGAYQDTIYFVLEDIERTELSFWRRIDKENPRYFQIYNDFLEYLKSRNFFRDYILVVNCTEYYPSLLFPVTQNGEMENHE